MVDKKWNWLKEWWGKKKKKKEKVITEETSEMSVYKLCSSCLLMILLKCITFIAHGYPEQFTD